MEYLVKAPQLSEAVQKVTVVRFLKNEGDLVQQDEPLLVLETEKAALDIESPVSGVITKICHSEGSSVAVGDVLVILSVDNKFAAVHNENRPALFLQMDYVALNSPSELTGIIQNTRNGALSPREKSYCLENKVIPLRLYKEAKIHSDRESVPNEYYFDTSIRPAQLKLIHAFKNSSEVIQTNIQTLCDNTPLEEFRKTLRKTKQIHPLPSRLEMICWGIVCTLRNHPAFCSRIINKSVLRQFKNPNLGIAVALKDDQLTTAVIPNVFSLTIYEMMQRMREAIEAARSTAYVPQYHCMTISDLSTLSVINAVPVVTAPAVATLFIGKPYLKQEKKNLFNFSLSFDHRVINGAGAALFLGDLSKFINNNSSIVPAYLNK